LARLLQNRKIRASMFGASDHFATTIDEFTRKLHGAIFVQLTRRGKYMLFECAGPVTGFHSSAISA